MSYKVINPKLEWVYSPLPDHLAELLGSMRRAIQITHWSRVFEYPWIIRYGLFYKGQWVLDAGGGSAPLQHFITRIGAQVVNVDLEEPSGLLSPVIKLKGDLKKLQFHDEVFDKVVCCSVLEHIENPEQVLHQLWRVLKPGGVLIGSFDVASYYRWNHTIYEEKAEHLLRLFGSYLPPCPRNLSTMWFPEIDREECDPTEVELKVLCFSFTKSTS